MQIRPLFATIQLMRNFRIIGFMWLLLISGCAEQTGENSSRDDAKQEVDTTVQNGVVNDRDAGDVDRGDDPESNDTLIKGAIYIESSDMAFLESYPVQVRMNLKGHLPTPCHNLATRVHHETDSVHVEAWSLSEPGAICAQVLQPFEESIPLGLFTSADSTVLLNGEEIGKISL